MSPVATPGDPEARFSADGRKDSALYSLFKIAVTQVCVCGCFGVLAFVSAVAVAVVFVCFSLCALLCVSLGVVGGVFFFVCWGHGSPSQL